MPALNIVVLTMLFSLMPMYTALTKIAPRLLMILAGFLGKVVAIFLPGEALLVTGFSALVLVLVLAGAFFPTPIGFDVVMRGCC